MGLTFPNKAVATNMYVSGLNHTISGYGVTVTLVFPSYLVTVSGSGLPGIMGPHFLGDGTTTFEPAGNFWGGGTPTQEVSDTKDIKMLCTLGPHSKKNIERIEDLGLTFRKELTYIYGKTYMSEYSNIINCDHALFSIPNSGIDTMKFRLASQPMDKNSIGQGNFITCWWVQVP